MEHHPLGRSGLRVSEITYGNWLTHGELVAGEAAVACVQAALEAGITTFDTADVYAAGIRLEAGVLARIDDVLGDLVDKDPAKTAQMMAVKPGWAQP